MSDVPVRVSRKFTASADVVFAAWLDPTIAAKFFFGTPTGEMVRAEIDPRVGGKFAMVDRRNGEDIEHAGEYVVVDAPRKLVFDFCVPKYSTELTRVTIELVPAGSGCEVTLSHVMNPKWSDFRERTEKGWTLMLERCAPALGE